MLLATRTNRVYQREVLHYATVSSGSEYKAGIILES